MGRMVMLAAGVLLGLWLLFTFLIPMVIGLLKVALIIGVIGVVLVIAVTVMSKSSSKS